jgi:hypothetical protein
MDHAKTSGILGWNCKTERNFENSRLELNFATSRSSFVDVLAFPLEFLSMLWRSWSSFVGASSTFVFCQTNLMRFSIDPTNVVRFNNESIASARSTHTHTHTHTYFILRRRNHFTKLEVVQLKTMKCNMTPTLTE